LLEAFLKGNKNKSASFSVLYKFLQKRARSQRGVHEELITAF